MKNACTDLRANDLGNPVIDDPQPRLTWLPPQDRESTAWQIVVASSRERLTPEAADRWTSDVFSTNGPPAIRYAGRTLVSREILWWSVRARDPQDRWCDWAEPVRFEMGLLQTSDWHGRWIAHPDLAKTGFEIHYPRFRREFTLASRPRWARFYLAGIGYCQPWINGEAIESVVLEPQVTRYDRQTYYLVLDVADQLQADENTIGIELASGFWNEEMPCAPDSCVPTLIAQLEWIDADGQHHEIVSDDSWQTGPGPWLHLGRHKFFDFGGDYYHHERERGSWATTGFQDRFWQSASAISAPCQQLRLAPNEPNAVLERLAPQSSERLTADTWWLDFGRVITGRIYLELAELPPCRIEMRAYDDGTPDGKREPGALFRQVDIVEVSNGPRSWRGRFGFRGFRYLEVRRDVLERHHLDQDVGTITAEVLGNDLRPRSSFACDDQLLTTIAATARHTFRMLTLGGIVCDCPNREKLGYGQETLVALSSGALGYHTAALTRKILADWRADQDPASGLLPWVSPALMHPFGGGGGPFWGLCPQHLSFLAWQETGDQRFIEDQHRSSLAYLRFLVGELKDSGDSLVPRFSPGVAPEAMINARYPGDWLSPRSHPSQQQTRTFRRLLVTFELLAALRQYIGIATELRENATADWCRDQAQRIADSLRRQHRDADTGCWGSGSQAELALAHQAHADEDAASRDRTLKLLLQAIHDADDRLTTGVLGTWRLFHCLTEVCEVDLAYRLITREGGPSWGDMIRNDATTFWESWYRDHSSHLHASFLGIGAWFIHALGGIRPLEPGYRHIELRPQYPQRLTQCAVQLATPLGTIVSSWQRVDDHIQCSYRIPPGAKATLVLGEDASASRQLDAGAHTILVASGSRS